MTRRNKIDISFAELTKPLKPTGTYIIKDFGISTAPVCAKPVCALMHRGLSNIQFLCDCGMWHAIADHPKTQNH